MSQIKGLNLPQNTVGSGFQYLIFGFKLLTQPKLRLFAIVPILVNILLFIGLTSFFFSYYTIGMDWLKENTWQWLHAFLWILVLLFGFLFLFAYGYMFTMLTNIIGAPFYGLLAEKVEIYLAGEGPEPESLAKMIPRVIGREISKQIYFISRGILVLIVVLMLSFTGIGSPIGTLIATLWGIWTLCVQYIDYPADNNQVKFKPLRESLKTRKMSTFGFGGIVMLGSMVPILNIFIAPAAVCGATAFWLNEIKGRSA